MSNIGVQLHPVRLQADLIREKAADDDDDYVDTVAATYFEDIIEEHVTYLHLQLDSQHFDSLLSAAVHKTTHQHVHTVIQLSAHIGQRTTAGARAPGLRETADRRARHEEAGPARRARAPIGHTTPAPPTSAQHPRPRPYLPP